MNLKWRYVPDFEKAPNNLKGLSIEQKSILRLVDLIVKADGEISKEELGLVNYINEKIILENDLDLEKVDQK